ncbi:protein BTG3-like [Gouania willdenowi]|uniref:protein BTG3-like n=1 Tax=Gouania willdenowi TaxID=441366 RepID=UPI001055B906|nr:protein BTG3-like [Gouania willdenowi]
MMRAEIAEVVSFLKSLVKLKNNVKAEKIDLFGKRLAVVLQEKFEGHWYPENPSKGQAYRCIRVNNLHQQDPELLRACRESGIKYSDLGLPWEITLWVDPGEVCGRYGENNFDFPVATLCKDTGKMVSEYHSDSSDEESKRSSPLTIPNRKCSNQTLNAAAPSWNPENMRSGMGASNPQPHNRTPIPWRNKLWVPPNGTPTINNNFFYQ